MEIESWVLRIVERVEHRLNIEDDSRVELKRAWIDPKIAARKIAGHANTANGEPILWIIGLDEKKGVMDLEDIEVANWYPQVEKRFDQGVAPDLKCVNVPVEDKYVVALYFETTRAPFVIKNPNGGKIEREVPWRTGTRTTSARRQDLIKLLYPRVLMPKIEIQKISFYNLGSGSLRGPNAWNFRVELYVIPKNEDAITLPIHKTCLHLFNGEIRNEFNCLFDTERAGSHSSLQNDEIKITPTGVTIKGTGNLYVWTKDNINISQDHVRQNDVKLRLSMGIASNDKTINVECDVNFIHGKKAEILNKFVSFK